MDWWMITHDEDQMRMLGQAAFEAGKITGRI